MTNSTDSELNDLWDRNLALPNILISFTQLPLSGLNIYLILRTSVLHPNLKVILLSQSVGFCAFAIGDMGRIYNMQIFSIDFNERNFFMALGYVGRVYSVAIGHILLIERAIATWMANRYEQWRKPWFTLIWFIFVFINCFYSTAKQMVDHLPQGLDFPLIVLLYILQGISLAEIVACLMLGIQNKKRYQAWLKQQHGKHNLGERYQLSENFRTARQLIPTFLLHFFITFFHVIIWIFIFLQNFGSKNFKLLSATNRLLISFCCVLIELTLICCHPIIRKNAQQLLNKLIRKIVCFGSNNQVSPVAVQSTFSGMTMGNEMDRHFEMLRRAWN